MQKSFDRGTSKERSIVKRTMFDDRETEKKLLHGELYRGIAFTVVASFRDKNILRGGLVRSTPNDFNPRGLSRSVPRGVCAFPSPLRSNVFSRRDVPFVTRILSFPRYCAFPRNYSRSSVLASFSLGLFISSSLPHAGPFLLRLRPLSFQVMKLFLMDHYTRYTRFHPAPGLDSLGPEACITSRDRFT